MSYILDALKKSEQKRPPGQVPDVFTVQGPQPAGKSRWSLVGVAGAAAVIGAAVVIVGWAWRSGRETPEQAPPAPAATTTASGAKTPAPAARGVATQGRAHAPARGDASTAPPIASTPARVSPARVHVASAPAPRREAAPAVPAAPPLVPLSQVPRRPTPAASTALRGGAVLRVTPAPEPGAVDAAVAPAMAQPSPVMPSSEAPKPAVPAETQPPAPAPPAVPAPVPVPALAPLPSSIAPPPAVNPATPLPVVTPQPVPIETAPPAPEPEAPPADGRVVGIEELPQDMRTTLAKFSVSGHVWSEEPTLRLLTVNDRIVREGQDAAPGVRLEQITQDGAVFSLRGWRFRVTGR